MANNPRGWLRKSLGSRLIPAFEQCGFKVVPLSGDDARSREIRSASPFGRLRREGPRGLEVVEIQLDKRGAAAFRLNVGIAPPEGGITLPFGRRTAQEDVWAGSLSHHFEVYRWPRLWRWFTVRRWFGSTTPSDFDALVDEVATFIPEIEEVLATGKPGPHIRVIDIPPVTPSASGRAADE